jgi:hypothetical protein
VETDPRAYGPQTTPPRSHRATTWILLGLAGVGLGATVAIGSSLRNDDDGASAGSGPLDVAQSYLAALRVHDCPAVIDHLSDAFVASIGERAGEPPSRRRAVAMCEANASLDAFVPDEVGDIVLASETAGAAVVEIETTYDGVSGTEQLPLVWEDGSWKVDVPPELVDDELPEGIPDGQPIVVDSQSIEDCAIPPDLVDNIAPQEDQDRYRDNCGV